MLFVVTTRWTCRVHVTVNGARMRTEVLTFDRKHSREATSEADARAQERAHNRTRAEMRSEGWRPRVVACERVRARHEKRASDVNREGLTFAEWHRAACVAPDRAARAAWRAGEDPSEHRAARASAPVMVDLRTFKVR